MLTEWVLVLTIFTGRTSAAIESIPMASLEACNAAGQAWYEDIQKENAARGQATHYHCINTGKTG